MAKATKKSVEGARANPWRIDANRLRKARTEKGWTQFDLARESGINATRVISHLERGVAINVTLETAGALADALVVKLDWLCTRAKSG